MNSILTQNAGQQNRYQDNYEKGLAFENFIIRLFNKRSFQLKEWQKSEKFPDSNLPLDYSDPDLEIELVFSGARKYRFAVECKWRKEFRDGKLNGRQAGKYVHTRIFKRITESRYLWR